MRTPGGTGARGPGSPWASLLPPRGGALTGRPSVPASLPPAGLYGADGVLPARRMLRPRGQGRWRQLWEAPTLLWEAPLLGLDTAQGLELLSLLGALLALGALLLRPLRHCLAFLLLWAAYRSACQASGAPPAPGLAPGALPARPDRPRSPFSPQVGQVFLYFQW